MPCIIGSLKTLDKKTFYKTADISQVWMSFLNLLVLTSFEESLSPYFSLSFSCPFHLVNGCLSFLIHSSIAQEYSVMFWFGIWSITFDFYPDSFYIKKGSGVPFMMIVIWKKNEDLGSSSELSAKARCC